MKLFQKRFKVGVKKLFVVKILNKEDLFSAEFNCSTVITSKPFLNIVELEFCMMLRNH